MEYVKAILMKYIITALLLWLILGVFYHATVGGVLLLSLLITGIGFLFGDLYMLPRFENWGATIMDFLLVYAAVWWFSTYFAVTIPSITAAAISAILIAACEVFFHRYVDSHILHEDNRTGGRTRDQLSPKERYQTEVGEEIDPIEEEKE